MGSNSTRKLARTIALGNPAYIDDGREKKSRTTGFPRSGLVHELITPQKSAPASDCRACTIFRVADNPGLDA